VILRRLKGPATAAACILALSACASLRPKPPPPHVVVPPPAAPPAAAAPAPPPKEVVIRAPAPPRPACVPKTFPRPPKYPDTDAALRDAGGAADRYQLLAAGRLLRDRRLAELEKVIEGCR
jgi:hypothetical protein